MTVVSRLKLNHPALGTAGGSALHTQIEGLYEKLGDNIADRLFRVLNLNAAASTDLDHNYNTSISNIHSDVYSYNEGTGEATYLDETTTPKLSEISLIAKVGDEKKQITVTNNSASQVDLLIILTQGVLKLSENDIKDIDIVSVAPEDGQSLVYSLSSGKFFPGASGDASFKLQSINGSGTQLFIKKGYIRLSDGRVLYLASDLTIDVSGIITTNGYWYVYIDVNTLSASSVVSGRKLVAIVSGNFVYSETAPEDNNLTRYIPMGQITRSGGSFTLVTTEAYRAYDFPLGADKSLEYTLPLQTISTVGTAGQIASGHQLASNSFPSAAIGANLSWYNLPDMNDDSGNGRTLTNNGGATFTTGILGDANQAVNLNGSSQYLSSTNPLFDPGDTDFTFGGWFNPTTWIPPGSVSYVLAAQWVAGTLSFALQISYITKTLTIIYTTDGSTIVTNPIYDITALTGWHHVSVKYIASTNTFYLYLDGKSVGSFVCTGNLRTAGASRLFMLGCLNGPTQYFPGKIDEFFFCNGTAFTDNDIAKIYASKLTHSRTLSPVSQKWLMTGISADGQARELLDNIVDMDTDDLYFDLSDEISTTQVELKLYNRSQTGLSKAAKPRTLMLTVDQLDALLPISHGLGVVPEISFKVQNLNGDYEPNDASAFVVNATQVKLADGSLVSLYGTGVNCILTYSTAPLAHFVPNKFWNPYKATSAKAILANDKIYADPSGGSFSLTLPATASIGDGMIVFDYKANFSVAAKVTLSRNGHNINGVAADYDLDVPGRVWQIEYIDSSYGFSVR